MLPHQRYLLYTYCVYSLSSRFRSC
ncbi:virulence promoting factor [Parabacteroides distasonis]|nr:virulence promoting factor [Parabacteroides distasonis]